MALSVERIFEIRAKNIFNDPVEYSILLEKMEYVLDIGLSSEFGDCMNKAIALYSLHLYEMDQDKSEDGDTKDAYKSVKEGQISITYNVDATNPSSFNATSWGRELNGLRKTCLVAARNSCV